MGLTAKGVPGGLATLDANGDVKAAQQVAATAIADLTISVGTADNTLADVTATPTQTLVNNNFADVGTKINAILAALRGAGIVAP